VEKSRANDAKGAQGIACGPSLYKENIGARQTVLHVKRTERSKPVIIQGERQWLNDVSAGQRLS
jgi:hypothetical protein